MDISIVITNWNDEKHLQICLESLADCSKTRSVEVIVVDNASTDGSAELVASRFPDVRLIRSRVNLGYPTGVNTGIRASVGDYVFVLNSDIRLLDDCVDRLVDYLDAHTDIGMIGPKILNGDLTHQSSCRYFPTLWNNFCDTSRLTSACKSARWLSGEHMLHFQGDRRVDVDVLVGCFWVLPRRAMEQFGLMDEGFFIYAEDVDWCKRCWAAGWRVVFYPEAQAIHYRGVSTVKKDPVRFAITQQQSVIRYWQKYHGVFGGLAIRGLLFMGTALRFVAVSARYLTQPKLRNEDGTKLRVFSACLGNLMRPSAL